MGVKFIDVDVDELGGKKQPKLELRSGPGLYTLAVGTELYLAEPHNIEELYKITEVQQVLRIKGSTGEPKVDWVISVKKVR
jgi:hypothetical protein